MWFLVQQGIIYYANRSIAPSDIIHKDIVSSDICLVKQFKPLLTPACLTEITVAGHSQNSKNAMISTFPSLRVSTEINSIVISLSWVWIMLLQLATKLYEAYCGLKNYPSHNINYNYYILRGIHKLPTRANYDDFSTHLIPPSLLDEILLNPLSSNLTCEF